MFRKTRSDLEANQCPNLAALSMLNRWDSKNYYHPSLCINMFFHDWQLWSHYDHHNFVLQRMKNLESQGKVELGYGWGTMFCCE